MLGAAALAVLGVQVPAPASTPPVPATTAAAAGHSPYEASCGVPQQGDFTCFALRRTDVKAARGVQPAAVAPAGYGPADLLSAYNIPVGGGVGQTVAVVDAFDDPSAEADLAVYRQQYGLPACTTANGCFRKVDQRGGTQYPKADPGWAGEISLDLDMVSAIAPNARILLVEADDTAAFSLGAAVDEAVALGARYVSNSYGSDYRGGAGEDPAETTLLDSFYNHPGVAVVASSGDDSYGVAYPAASQYVTSVGGTSLFRDPGSSRGWSESAWAGAGSGCSQYEPKPAFQTDTGCANRAVADVSAVADLATGVAVYQTYGRAGWQVYGGTSVAAPIIAGVYAAAGTPVSGSYPNSYPYAAKSGLHDVTSGSNGTCAPSYLCSAAAGYDGPTGLGTPDGLTAFRAGPHGEVTGTVTDSSTGEPVSGATVTAGDATATSDAAGKYSLALPVGSYDLGAEAFGYAAGTVKGVALSDGASLTEDFALTALPGQTISGTVTDGSGHGWPLYARITVDGAPGGVWTDPLTGGYQVRLPSGHDWTLHVTTSVPGYEEVTRSVAVGDSPQTVNLPVPADAEQATAPGYAVHWSGPTESFDATGSAPQGWSVVDAPGTEGGWEFDDPAGRGNNTGGDGGFAIVDSDHAGATASQDTQLVSPSYDLSGYTTPVLAFNTEYQAFDGEKAAVDASTDGGAGWTTLWSTTDGLSGDARIQIPLGDLLGHSDVRFRFHYTAAYGFWWSVDNVFVGQRDYTATPGSWITGEVTDANTGAGLVAATVTDRDDPALTATTVATPDDPNLGDGFYAVFTPEPGGKALTAAKASYTPVAKNVKAGADSVVAANFRLKAGRLAVNPGSVDASVGWGKQTTKVLTVKNTGGAPATLTVNERSGGFRMETAQGAPPQRVPGSFSPLSDLVHGRGPSASTPRPAAAPSADGGWQPGPNLPQNVMDNAVGASGGKVYSAFGYNGDSDLKNLYVLDPVAGSWTERASAADTRESPAHGFLDGKFYAVGGYGADGNPDPKLEIYDPATDHWTTGASSPAAYAGSGSAVLDNRLYVIGGCVFTSCGTTDVTAYDPTTDSWTRIAPYPEPIAWQACAGIDGRIYCAGGMSDQGEVGRAYVYDPEFDTWSPMPAMPTAQWASSYSSANGLLVLSGGISGNAIVNLSYAFDPKSGRWSALPNAGTATYRGGGTLGFYKVGGGVEPFTPAPVVELLPGYDQPEPAATTWLGESAEQLTLQPGGSAQITVTLDSSVPEITQPGDFTAHLWFTSDTPYPITAVPVTMTVAPPKTWGKITGTVLATGSGATPRPLTGATVQIDSWAGTYSLTTAADGSFALWLDTRNNPLTLIVFKDGYQAVVDTVKLTKGGTVTRTYTLKKN